MDPNLIPNQPEQPTIPAEPTTQQIQPKAQFQQPVETQLQPAPTVQPMIAVEPSIKKDKRKLIKIIVGALILMLIAGGIGVYAWQSNQAPLDNSPLAAVRERNNDYMDTDQMKNSRVLSIAAMVAQAAQIYDYDHSSYPITLTELINAADGMIKDYIEDKHDMEVTSSQIKLSAYNGTTNITYEYSGSSTNATGCRIGYWDYKTKAVAYQYFGDAKVESNFFDPITDDAKAKASEDDITQTESVLSANAQRKKDLNRILTAVVAYQSNNRGALPSTLPGWSHFVNEYILVDDYVSFDGDAFNDPSQNVIAEEMEV